MEPARKKITNEPAVVDQEDARKTINSAANVVPTTLQVEAVQVQDVAHHVEELVDAGQVRDLSTVSLAISTGQPRARLNLRRITILNLPIRRYVV